MELFTKIKAGDEGRLICFPYLGGYVNSFGDLVQSLNRNLEVWVANPPGHLGSNLDLVSDINTLTDLYYQEIGSIISADSCFLGHSMGGVVAFALINKIRANGQFPLPDKLILSATSKPDVFAAKQYSSFSDDDLVEILKSYGGLPAPLLANHELMNIMRPIFRADYRILESAAATLQQIDVKTLILWGENDKVESIENAYLWRDLLSQGLNVITLKKASHLFIHDRAAEVADYVEKFMGI